MPVDKLSLKLSFPSLKINFADKKPLKSSTDEHLKNNFTTLQNQMREMPMCSFKMAQDAPDYSGIRQSGFFAKSQGFQLQNSDDDAFIHARRETPYCRGEFSGDKFHISIAAGEVPQAFQALSGWLFSEDSPIDKWKVTDMERVDQHARVAVGAQFTLYVKPEQENSLYNASALHKIRQFIASLESTLAENGFTPGQRPESDVHPDDWKYVSYRNERRSGREGGEMQHQALREEPFYRLMTG